MEGTPRFSERLPAEALRPLMVRRDGPGLRRFGLQYGLFLASIAATLALTGPLRVAAVLAHSVLLASLFAPFHESTHRTAFRTPWLNDAVAWLAGAPLLFPPPFYRDYHFAHHRHTHDPERDPEIHLAPEKLARWASNPIGHLVTLTGLPLLAMTLFALAALALPHRAAWWARWAPYVAPARRLRVSLSSGGLLLGVAALTVGALGWPALWGLVAGQVVARALLTMFFSAEHVGLPFEGDALSRTRSTRTNALVRWLMWNMPWHAEHHGWPGVPWHALPALHALVEDQLPNLAPGYLRLHAAVLRGEAQGSASPGGGRGLAR
ncbi:MAG: fatty acid desaturase [Alphaproteobacteria bacterium]|nr:fatty acid desaturase [Alphaproteobacteria bacterium]